jgi:hypothetical protein
MTDDLVSRGEAEEILAPYRGDIVAIVRGGWRAWKNDLSPEVAANRSRRSRASFVHDEMTREAHRRFDELPGVHVTEKRGFITVTFENTLVLRFKKFTGVALRTGGVRTKQRAIFQSQQLVLDGLRVTTVVAGYLLDDVEQELQEIAVVCPRGRSNAWVISLDAPSDPAGNVAALSTHTGSYLTVQVRSALDADEEKEIN